MKCLLCVEPSDAERVTTSASRYLSGATEVVVLCAVDESGPRGYGLSVRGLLGRRSRSADLEATSESTARETAESVASNLSGVLPDARVEARTLSGRPEEEIARLAEDEGFDAVLIGRGNTGPEVPVTLAGTVSTWKTNRHGDRDGLYLQTDEPEPVEVKFPPHRGEEIGRAFTEGSTVEVSGSRRGGGVHAYTLSEPGGGGPVEAHRPPEKEGGLLHVHLGHTARFVTDHVTCDVVLIS